VQNLTCNVDMDMEVILSVESNPQCGYGYGGYIECGIQPTMWIWIDTGFPFGYVKRVFSGITWNPACNYLCAIWDPCNLSMNHA
jgi:hypothetical protein